MRRLLKKVDGIEGSVVECGVGKMDTFKHLAIFLREQHSDRMLVGFDSFEGFPEPTVEDVSFRNPQKGEWKFIDAPDVQKFLRISGFSEEWITDHIKIVKGFFQDTLPFASEDKIAFLHLDVDLYDSYKTCLEYFFPKVSEGGVLLFDEYDNNNESERFPGAKKAIDEYFKDTPYVVSRDWFSGKYYLVKQSR